MARQAKKQKSVSLSPARLRPMEAKLVDALPKGGTWQFEPKWDGFRCLVFREALSVQLVAKSGKPLSRYFPEIVAAIEAVKPAQFILDGELLVPIGDSLSFDALQMRLHPAQSRISKLSTQTPALFMAFDIITDDAGTCYLFENLRERRAALERQLKRFGKQDRVRLSPYSREISDAKKMACARWSRRARWRRR